MGSHPALRFLGRYTVHGSTHVCPLDDLDLSEQIDVFLICMICMICMI